MKEVTIELHFISNETKVMQAGSFPPRGKSPAHVALTFFQEIKRRMPFGAELVKVLIDDEDKTELVKELENAKKPS